MNDNKNVIIILLVFLIGLVFGYFFGTNNMHNGFWMNDGYMHRYELYE